MSEFLCRYCLNVCITRPCGECGAYYREDFVKAHEAHFVYDEKQKNDRMPWRSKYIRHPWLRYETRRDKSNVRKGKKAFFNYVVLTREEQYSDGIATSGRPMWSANDMFVLFLCSNCHFMFPSKRKFAETCPCCQERVTRSSSLI